MHEFLRRLDMNLLLLFDALYEHRQVTQAGLELGLTQSATSHALARLREHLGDPLFVRGASGLTPTTRASSMAPAVRLALHELGRALAEGADFDPTTATRGFRIAAADAFDITLLPQLLEALSRHAPGVDLEIVRPGQDIGRSLLEGNVDLYYGVLPNRPEFSGLLLDPGSRGLQTRAVYEEDWSFIVRRGHPRIRRKPTLKQYAAESHVVFSPKGGGPGVVDRLLAEHGRARRVALRVSSFHSALDAVARTDMVYTGPRRIAEVLDPTRELLHTHPPLELPVYPAHMVWHERFQADPAHRWLREQVASAGRASPDGGRGGRRGRGGRSGS